MSGVGGGEELVSRKQIWLINNIKLFSTKSFLGKGTRSNPPPPPPHIHIHKNYDRNFKDTSFLWSYYLRTILKYNKNTFLVTLKEGTLRVAGARKSFLVSDQTT